jgi:2-polyprenyl-6-hydroxyphenyl methylase/3-demethylubiquinone-9 3-methyltransferase
LRSRLQALIPGEFVWQRFGPADAHAHLSRPIISMLDDHGARSVLDLGCGNGWFTAALSRCGFQATGIDISASGIEIARRQSAATPFLQHDLTQPLAPELVGRFDAVVAIELLDHLRQPRRALEAAMLALRPGGLLIVSAPHHGYAKNLALALSGRFDARWHALQEHGRVKFFSRTTLLALLGEFDLRQLRCTPVGRVPALARSLLASGCRPDAPPAAAPAMVRSD